MPKTAPFTIYNASAGSGKTYTLVKEYLKVLFASDQPQPYRRILAITFTNKAVAEMKERIIEMLKQFSDESILKTSNSMFATLCEELQIPGEVLHQKSKTLLNSILHNYAAFDISTIDGFTHKLIRTFAFDLKLPVNFEVELDQESLLNEAVDSLISHAGTDDELTKVLVDFSIEKADDDKSWDISHDLNKIAKLLLNENDKSFIEALKDKTLDDFKALKAQLKTSISAIGKTITETAQKTLALIDEAGLEHGDFSGAYLPKHFQKLSKGNFDVGYESKWQEDLANKTLYPKRVSPNIASTIEQIQPEIASFFETTKEHVYQLKFLKAVYKNITPLSVLNAINKELSGIKEEQNKMLISEFNTIISKEIKAQPTPFIYERIGEKFKHYFIDEFQDTSVMQWENLIPLLENALSAEGGSALLVGDAKQAIYRWRGGKAEQFIDLFNAGNPFQAEKQVENLPSNYRSYREVVNFNNGFFEFLGAQVFQDEKYASLYKTAPQGITKNGQGFVSLAFLDIEKEDDRDEFFPDQVLCTINSCLENGFKLKDICVLTRKKKEGVAVASYLSGHHIPVVSSETLLIDNSSEVRFVNDVLTLLMQPKNNEVKVNMLNYLTLLFNIEDKHAFFKTHIDRSLSDLFRKLEAFNIIVNPIKLLQLPLYDLAETIVRTFKLAETSNAYIQFYLDIVLEFSQKKGADISSFLEYFNQKKENLSIIAPQGQNAVQIMTIHKSKGLEFPVVIFPYADLDIYREIEPKEWIALEKEEYQGFSHTLLNYSKAFEHFGEQGKSIFKRHQSELELDNINLLYVALTRAVGQLHVISSKDISSKGEANTRKYSGLLISYLQHLGIWNDSQLIYIFGNTNEVISNDDEISSETQILEEFISTDKSMHNIKVVTKSGNLWDTQQQAAIERGNLVHDILAQIKTKLDIDFVITDFKNSATITDDQAKSLVTIITQIVEHPLLQSYYQHDLTIYNERDIISKEGIVLRPDRIVINEDNEAVIIDYKTGAENKHHKQQLQLYKDALEAMSFKVHKCILVFINENISVKSF
ncbi:UvrD-helicase domain-containing protein [Hyunsoonleella sp. SJ7]|uniref:DNA 3'-5' helicase n=1 Tax=Hyunsoonleella aquatilis TaxID=2762758 RepID=A0A923HFD6_9FLAO|nr:UvrD-helicase domain-containing protein [Hyunsoonleella aquatilis]MBC3758385.1 UvrD-helicase domain-containing protein [Hyunsoonleella aquatilis]